jgi:NarL family two-component system response regulator LiaR
MQTTNHYSSHLASQSRSTPMPWVSKLSEQRTMNQISVFVVDDHSIFRRGLAAMIEAEPSLMWAGEATSGAEAIVAAPVLRPDVVLIDMVTPEMDGVKTIQTLRSLLPRTRFVGITCTLDATIARRALEAGATGYMLKTATANDISSVITSAHMGHRFVANEVAAALEATENQPVLGADLTRRERNLLELMACGLANQEISQRLDIGLPTVKFHVTNILSKLQAENRTAAVLAALRHRIVVLEK